MLTLTARAIASQLDPNISANVTVAEISRSTGLPANQVRARGTELIKGNFAKAQGRGVYRVLPHRIEGFLDRISAAYGRDAHSESSS